ncbi:MAG: DUF1553 domain-containing protein [Pirellulales bacterium]
MANSNTMIGRILLIIACLFTNAQWVTAHDGLFAEQVAPILQRHCLNCHNDNHREGGLSLQTANGLLDGGDSGEVVVAGDPDSSYLLELVTPTDGAAEMPQSAAPLSEQEQTAIRNWIADGAHWPQGLFLEPPVWWSLQPIARPKLPPLSPQREAWCRTPIDRFIAAHHEKLDLQTAATASRRVLIRRLSFDLTGLPPTIEEIDAFVADPSPDAYPQLVNSMLASPRYGERWARHWLDVVHYGETHGYDKDKQRPNAWPYRDYVIRAFNNDKPYGKFIEEQIAGDVLHEDTVDGIEALGFIAAGPWDFIGHAEVPETKIDGKVARHLDRDDMVRNTMMTFVSLTVGCAQCHDHKFDPITQKEYYGLQAVFAALDRTDREYYDDPRQTHKHDALLAQKRTLLTEKKEIDATIEEQGGKPLAELREKIAKLQKTAKLPVQYGYHSAIESDQAVVKWVQVDLGEEVAIERIEIIGCHDDFNNIGAGFGFPRRYKIELADNAQFTQAVRAVVEPTDTDIVNPGTTPQMKRLDGAVARFVRVTATKLAPRQNDFIFALAELKVLNAAGDNVALNEPITALDSIESGMRWSHENLVDGYFPGAPVDGQVLTDLETERDTTLQRQVDAEVLDRRRMIQDELVTVTQAIDELPPAKRVYAGTVHHGSGSFRGTGPDGGQPRPIHLLLRGDIKSPGDEVTPGALGCIESLDANFTTNANADEGDRRAQLARWLSSANNPLTWRSIVNRVWQYHFGRGLVNTPGDFGRMGERPTHPKLLDWLALEFRNGGGSLKQLHRLIVNSAVYRQSSRLEDCPQCQSHQKSHQTDNLQGTNIPTATDPRVVDSGNRFWWRMNRRQLEAEAVRDSLLMVSGKLNLKMGGPSFQDFVIEKPEHSPHYQYHLHDPEDPTCHRRSVYRFIVRSQTQPFMTVMDCADPSIMVGRRSQTITPLQALTLMNNSLSLVMSRHFAERVGATEKSLSDQVMNAYHIALGREPTAKELAPLNRFAETHGMANVCRVIMNLNEFVFVD